MNLEQRVEANGPAYIESLVYDAGSGTVRASFMRADVWVVYGTLTFRDVRDYRCEFDTKGDQQEVAAGILIEGLLGIAEMETQADANYCIKTDAREIAFTTTVAPTWSPVEKGTDVDQRGRRGSSFPKRAK